MEKTPEINRSEKQRLSKAVYLNELVNSIVALLRSCDQNDRKMLRKENDPYLNLILDAYGKFILKEDELSAPTETESFDVV